MEKIVEMEGFLKDDFCITGEQMDILTDQGNAEKLSHQNTTAFLSTVRQWKMATKAVVIYPMSLAFGTVKELNDAGIIALLFTSAKTVTERALLDKENKLYQDGINKFILTKAEIMKKLQLNMSQLTDIIKYGYFIRYMDVDGTKYTFLPSKKLLTHICKKAGQKAVKGRLDAFRTMSLMLDMRPIDPFLLLYRENSKGRKKAFSCFSVKNRPDTHSIFAEAVMDIQRKRPTYMVRYNVEHYISTAEVVFCDTLYNPNTMAYGCRIQFSDVGDGALLYQPVIYWEGGTYPFGKISEKPAVLIKKGQIKNVFHDMPATEVDEETFISSTLLTYGEAHQFGRLNVKNVIEWERERQEFRGTVTYEQAMRRMLAMSRHIDNMADSTKQRFLCTLGSILENEGGV